MPAATFLHTAVCRKVAAGVHYGYQEKLNLLLYHNKYQGSHKHSCFSRWWAYSRPKHVEIDKYKYTKNKLCTKLVLFTRNWYLLLNYKFSTDVLEGKDVKNRCGEKWVSHFLAGICENNQPVKWKVAFLGFYPSILCIELVEVYCQYT